MRVRATAIAVVLCATALTACSSGDSGAESKPSAAEARSGAATSSASKPSGVEQGMELGSPAQTTGDGGTGVLEITPDTVVYVKKGGGETAANGLFAVVTMKDKAMTAVAADEPAPIAGGGWRWMGPDGEMIGFDSGNSSSVVMDKYNNAEPVQPGSFQWRAQVFDLTKAQAKGGTLIYIDGEEKAFRWKIPPEDAGPNVAEVKKQLAF